MPLVAGHPYRLVAPGNTTGITSGVFTPGSSNFAYTGVDQSFQVPYGATTLTVTLSGAGGGINNQGALGDGGRGGLVSGKITVTALETLIIVVGGKGGNALSGTSTPGGYGGGGIGASPGYYGGGGGGRSAIRRSGADIVTAGGGGGGAYYSSGGDGGGLTGGSSASTGGGYGGGQVNGGAGGSARRARGAVPRLVPHGLVPAVRIPVPR